MENARDLPWDHRRNAVRQEARCARGPQAPGRCPPPVPHLSPTCNQRTTTDTARDLPLDHQATENARLTVKQPEPQEKREIYGRQTDGRETREIYRGTTRPRKTREIYRGTRRKTQLARRHTVGPTYFSETAFRSLSRQVTESGLSARLKLH